MYNFVLINKILVSDNINEYTCLASILVKSVRPTQMASPSMPTNTRHDGRVVIAGAGIFLFVFAAIVRCLAKKKSIASHSRLCQQHQ